MFVDTIYTEPTAKTNAKKLSPEQLLNIFRMEANGRDFAFISARRQVSAKRFRCSKTLTHSRRRT